MSPTDPVTLSLQHAEPLLVRRPSGHTCLPKIVANRPGLATLKCSRCGRKWLHEYADAAALEQIRETLKRVRSEARRIRL